MGDWNCRNETRSGKLNATIDPSESCVWRAARVGDSIGVVRITRHCSMLAGHLVFLRSTCDVEARRTMHSQVIHVDRKMINVDAMHTKTQRSHRMTSKIGMPVARLLQSSAA